MEKRQCTHAKQPGYLLELVAVLDDPAAAIFQQGVLLVSS
jgi:hypothetical protein